MAIIEKYANFDLATGLNDGTSEANAWQTPAAIVFVAGVRVNLKTPTRYSLLADWDILVATSGTVTQPIILRGYETTIGDGGFAKLETTDSWYRLLVEAKYFFVEGFDCTSIGPAGNQVILHIGGMGGLSRIKIAKTTTGQYTAPLIRVDASAVDNIYLETSGDNTSTDAAIYCNGARVGNIFVVSNNGQGGIRIRQGYQANAVSNIAVYSKVATTLAGIWCDLGVNSYHISIENFTVHGFGIGVLFEQINVGENSESLMQGVISGATNAITTNEVTTRTGIFMKDIAFYNNTNNYSAMGDNEVFNPILLTTEPFVDSANGDFRPNNTVGGGRLLRGQSEIGVGMVINNRDIGALQHTDPINPTLGIGI